MVHRRSTTCDYQQVDDPEGFLDHARSIGVIPHPTALIAKIPPRPILLVHGADDETVPLEDARVLAHAAGDHGTSGRLACSA